MGLEASDGAKGLWLSFGRGTFSVGKGRDQAPGEIEATAYGDPGTLYDLILGRVGYAEAIDAGALEIVGDAAVVAAMLAAFPGSR